MTTENPTLSPDTQRMIDVLDKAMSSDDPRVQEAMRRLMVTSALLDTDPHTKTRSGPLNDIVRNNKELRDRVANLESSFRELQNHLRRVSLVPDNISVISNLDSITLTQMNLSDITGPYTR